MVRIEFVPLQMIFFKLGMHILFGCLFVSFALIKDYYVNMLLPFTINTDHFKILSTCFIIEEYLPRIEREK